MMEKYKTYSRYKDSEDERLSYIPQSWDRKKLKFLAKIKNGQDYKSIEVDTGYPVLGSGGQFTASSKYLYDRPSVLLGRKGTVDKPIYIDEPFWTVDTMYYTEIKNEIPEKFFYYLCLTIPFGKYITSTALPSMTQENLSNNIFYIPINYEEKQNIANFLDYETSKMDMLIEKQQQLIKLLEEKRQAVISHAVTKGLNPNVSMKDSGVEWLGEIPEHWQIWKLAHAFEIIGSGTTPPSDTNDWYGDDINWVTTGELREDIILSTSKKIKKKTLQYFSTLKIYPKGTILIAMYGATIGRLGILGESATTNQACCALSNSNYLFNMYLFYWLISFRQEIIQLSSGGGQPNINQEKVAALKISTPTLEEQKEIISFLDQETLKLRQLMVKANKVIELLKERRTALISAAVTGKIDVRDWQAPTVTD